MRTILGTLAALVSGGIAAVVLGCAQMLVLHEFRGITAALLLAVGLGAAVGWFTGQGARLWHLRDPKIIAALALVTGVLAQLVTFWVLAHLLVFGEEGATVPVLVPLGELSPAEVLTALRGAIGEGAWHWTRHYHFRGVALVLVWIVDTLVVVGSTMVFALYVFRERPYCESCQAWLIGPRRVGPLALEHDLPEEDPDPELSDVLRRLTPARPDDPCTYFVDLWCCRCSDRASAAVQRVGTASEPERLVEREPIPREVCDLLLMREHQPPIASQPVPTGWAGFGGLPDARVPDQDSRWVRPCSSCGRKLATGFWDHVNGFAVRCPHCGARHSRPSAMRQFLAVSMLIGPLAFFLSMRPLRASLAALVAVAIFLAGRQWFAAHPSFALECTFYVVLLLGCVIVNALAYVREHSLDL